jgi:acetyl-CoA acetyltransferase
MDEVLSLFRRAVDTGDAAAMREGLVRLLSGDGGVSALEEYELRHEDYVMDMPQSGERISGRDRMRSMQESFPGPAPTITIERVMGAGHLWLVEGVNDYGDGDLWHVVLAMEFAPDGRILRERRYYAKDFEPPAWRAAFVDPPEPKS